MKSNLPVILLKQIVVLPHNEVKLEFDTQESKNLLDISEMFHNNKLLIVCIKNHLEERIMKEQLPSIGVVAKVINKIELPNGAIRVVVKGIKRVAVLEYLNFEEPQETLESIIEDIPNITFEEKVESILKDKIYRELEKYVKQISYTSNSVLSIIQNANQIADITDIVAPYLSLKFDRLYAYYLESNSKNRVSMLLEDIYESRQIFEIEKEIDSKVMNELNETQKNYFLKEKIRLIKEELGEEEDDLKEKIQSLEAPEKIKKRLLLEYKHYQELSMMSPEASVIKTYIEWLLALPWSTTTEDNLDIASAKEILNRNHAGLEQVKNRIIEFLAVRKKTNAQNSPILCFVGPPGVGKTTLAYSIAEATGRNFVKISVGGMHDDSEIMGHRRTYLGAKPGRIISSMKKAKTLNPVFLIDEIDKLQVGIHGDPASSLLEVLDPTQNQYFSDHYIEEEYDLSQVMFLVTANRIETIPEALKDRLEIIELSGYTELEKLNIAKKHLIPTLCQSHNLARNQFIISDDTIKFLIQEYTREAGVRELKRQLETLIRKIVTEMVLKKKEAEVYHITKKVLIDYLGKEKYPKTTMLPSRIGVVNGLAYTSYGGDTLAIEVNYYKGTGKLVLTGSLGDVMKESAMIALSYLKANVKQYGILETALSKNDIHIHVPEGAIKKDGPSAGIALTTALISMFTGTLVPSTVALTGEITLRGQVLPIGGLKEKSIGAVRSGVTDVIIPSDNKRDLADVPIEIRKRLHYHFVNDYSDVYNLLFLKRKKENYER